LGSFRLQSVMEDARLPDYCGKALSSLFASADCCSVESLWLFSERIVRCAAVCAFGAVLSVFNRLSTQSVSLLDSVPGRRYTTNAYILRVKILLGERVGETKTKTKHLYRQTKPASINPTGCNRSIYGEIEVKTNE